ncbi:hypothetical protein EDD11_000610 [Mortierella claussenii]|nr:hypothetical protein EDD11_000610 [Mortierella claussenii]
MSFALLRNPSALVRSSYSFPGRMPPTTTATAVSTIRRFTVGTCPTYALKKQPLNKKITIPKDPYLLSGKVVKFAKNNKLDDAITLVLEAPKTRQNEVVWNHLIQESSKLGKANQSWQLLNDMKKRGFELSERTYTILLNALAVNVDSPNCISRAEALYQQMQQSEETTPTVAHTNALLKVCARKPDYDALQRVYNDMPKSGPNASDVVTFSTLINSYARMGGDRGFELAWKVWEDYLEAKTRRPDEVDLDEALVDAILLACREAKSSAYVKRGYRLVESLYGLRLSPATPGVSVESTASLAIPATDPSKVLGVGAILKKDTIQPRTVELLLSICVKLKDYSKAQGYMDLVRTTYPDFKADSQLMASMIHLQISNKEYEKAIQTWDEIQALGLRQTPTTLKQGLDAALKARNWDKTQEMYRTMIDLIRQNRNIDTTHRRPISPIVHQQDAWTLASTLKCAVKTKHITEAIQILRESHWASVVQHPRYPRANADVAEQAIKVYTAALKTAKSPGASDEAKGQEGKAMLDTERLEAKLKEAKDLWKRLSANLIKYDEQKAQKEVEEREAYRSRRKGSVPSETSALGDLEQGQRTTWREDSKYKSGSYRKASGGQRPNRRETLADSSRNYRRKNSDERSFRSRIRPEDELRPTRTFSRGFSLDS